MKVKGQEYSKRLASYSKSTLQLITDINCGSSKEIAMKKTEIIATTDNEQEVVQKLTQLLAQAQAT